MKLTKTQELFYHMDRFTGGRGVGICAAALYPDRYSVAEIDRGMKELVRRNDALRLRISLRDGTLFQEALPYEEREFAVLHFESRAALDTYAAALAREPMDVFGVLCDIRIVTVPGAVGLLARMHHIINDAWGFGVMRSQFMELLHGGNPESFSFFDHAAAEEAYLGTPHYARDRAYFEEICRSRAEAGTGEEVGELRAERYTQILDTELSAKIRAYAAERSLSPPAVLLTALAACLNAAEGGTGQVCLGMSFLNRMSRREKSTVGAMVNAVPLLLPLRQEAAFDENVSRTAGVCFRAMRHQRFSLAMLQEEDSGLRPPYDVLFSYQAEPAHREEGIAVWYPCGAQTERLQVHVDDRNGEGIFRVSYDYRTSRISEAEIHRFHERLVQCLSAAMRDPGCRLGEIDLLTPEEHRIFDSMDRTDRPLPDEQTVFGLFSRAVSRSREKICILNDRISFGTLEQLAGALDGALYRLTGGKKQVIALLADRGPAMYLAMYGVLRGGNAYLPIPTDFPAARIRFILEDSGAELVLGQERFRSSACGKAFLSLDAFLADTHAEPVPAPRALPSDIAYVIYTSGSTGKPKGTLIRNDSAVNRLLWMERRYPLGADGVILAKTPYAFDVSVWENFWWGICGGSLAYTAPGEHFLPGKILDCAEKYRATHLHFVPSVFDLFLDYAEAHPEKQSGFESVRHVFLSGETLKAGAVRRFYRLFPDKKLHNLYGPTECTVDVSFFDCDPAQADPVPIGRPIDNVRLYVLSPELRRLPIGVRGELCAAGLCVARGYRNRPELTAARFVPNPFGPGRLYRTGDLAYVSEAGEIVFCGRADGQVKIHGQRVEPGEIEQVIAAAPGVTGVCVLAEPENGGTALTAYYTGQSADPEELRRVCAAALPTYMIPAVFLPVKCFPVNGNGKLDRRALAGLHPKTEAADTSGEKPRDPAVASLCALFAEILDCPEVTGSTDFFHAGGSSLDVIRLLSADDRFRDVDAADFIRSPTPTGLAELLRRGESPERLKLLRESPAPRETLVIFPFAGGEAEAFARLAAALGRRRPELELRFAEYPRSDAELEALAAELAAQGRDRRIYFYAHCVGCAAALRLTARLAEKYGLSCTRLFAAACVPPRKGAKSPWKRVPDGVLRLLLAAAGSPIRRLDREQAAQLLARFTADADAAFSFFSGQRAPVKTPVSVLLSRRDIFTPNYAAAGKSWKRYAETVDIQMIRSRGHYFQTELPDAVAEWILSGL